MHGGSNNFLALLALPIIRVPLHVPIYRKYALHGIAYWLSNYHSNINECTMRGIHMELFDVKDILPFPQNFCSRCVCSFCKKFPIPINKSFFFFFLRIKLIKPRIRKVCKIPGGYRIISLSLSLCFCINE